MINKKASAKIKRNWAKIHEKAIRLEVKQAKHHETNNPKMQSEEVLARQLRYYELKKRNAENADN